MQPGIDIDALRGLPLVPGFPDYCYSSDWKIFRLTAKRGTKPGKEIVGGFTKEGRWSWILRRPDGRAGTLHRAWLVCEHFHGPRPAGLLALHGNGNPSDDRRDNLRWGTMKENMQDMVAHGRAGRVRGNKHGSVTKPASVPRGEGHVSSVLTEDIVLKIRSSSGRHIDIARQHNVSRSLVGAIKRREVWKHLEEGND